MSYWDTNYHLVWATKNRYPYIDDAGAQVIERSFRFTCEHAGAVVRAIGFMPDHVHLALSIPPRWAVSQLVRDLKVSATHAVNRDSGLPYAGSFYWQGEFGVITFGGQSLDDVVYYVQHQREHHANNRLRPRFERTDRREESL